MTFTAIIVEISNSVMGHCFEKQVTFCQLSAVNEPEVKIMIIMIGACWFGALVLTVGQQNYQEHCYMKI